MILNTFCTTVYSSDTPYCTINIFISGFEFYLNISSMEMADLGKKPENESFRASIKRKLKKSFRRERKGSNASQR